MLNTGYISEETADEKGNFSKNPTVAITLEAAFKCFGLTLEFGRNAPECVVFILTMTVSCRRTTSWQTCRRQRWFLTNFLPLTRLVLEFTKGSPGNRVILDNVRFGDSTDYSLEYGTELTKTPKGIQLTKVQELQVIRTLYGESEEEKELAKETLRFTPEEPRYTFYLSNPSYGFSAVLTEPPEGASVAVTDSSAYYVTVEVKGINGTAEVAVNGREYVTSQARTVKRLHTTGTVEVWENPLVSDAGLAEDWQSGLAITWRLTGNITYLTGENPGLTQRYRLSGK